MSNEQFDSLRAEAEALNNAHKILVGSDVTIDACIEVITALKRLIFHQLRCIQVQGNSVVIKSLPDDVVFKLGTLTQNFQSAAQAVYGDAAEEIMKGVERATKNLATFDELFQMLAIIESLSGATLPVTLWEDSQTAAVTITGVQEKRGPAGTQIALFRDALLKIVSEWNPMDDVPEKET